VIFEKNLMNMKATGNAWNKTLIIFFASMIVGLSSCLDPKYDLTDISSEFEISPEVAIPLAFGSLSLDDLLNQLDSNQVINQYSDSLLYIYYSDSLFSYNASELIPIPDQDFLQFDLSPSIPVAFTFPNAIGDTISEIVLPPLLGGTIIPLLFEQELEFSFSNNERIDSLLLESMNMHIEINSTFQNKLLLDFHTGNIVVDGSDFREVIELDNTATSLDKVMNDVVIKLATADNGSTILGLMINLRIINEGNPIRPGDKCEISMSFKDMEFSAVYGYLGDYDILTDSGSIDVSFLSNKILGGSISIANPELVLHINNSFGVPISLGLDMEVVSNLKDPPTRTPITFNGGDNSFKIIAPDLESFEIPVATDITINSTNSNFVRAMETSPEFLNYTATATINKDGNTNTSNFVTNKSMVDIGFEVSLPIEISATGFIFEDTLDLDFEEQFGENLDMIEYFGFTMGVTNEIPLELKLQVYFCDDDPLKTVLDSLFRDDDIFLNPAPVGPDGIHTVAEYKVNKVEYNDEQLQKIKATKYARIRATVNTPGTEYFKFYSFYKLGFDLGATVQLNINSNEL